MKRNLIGVIALGLVLAGAVGLMLGYSANSQEGMAAGVGLRVGLVLGAFWMAYPQLIALLKPVPTWLLGTGAVGALVVVVQPKLFFPVAIVVGALISLQFAGRFLATRPKNKRGRRRDEPPAAPRRPPGANP